MVLINAVSATVKAPCHGTRPWERLADFLAAIRYLKVGIVVKMTTVFGAKKVVKVFKGSAIFQNSSLKSYLQLYIL